MNKQGEIKPKDVDRQIDLLVIPELAPTLKKIGNDCYNKGKKRVNFFSSQILYIWLFQFTVTPSNDACAYAFEIVMCGYQTDSKVNENHNIFC